MPTLEHIYVGAPVIVKLPLWSAYDFNVIQYDLITGTALIHSPRMANSTSITIPINFLVVVQCNTSDSQTTQ